MCKLYIGVSLEVDNTLAALVNESGELLDYLKSPTCYTFGVEYIFNDIVTLCKQLIDKHNLNHTTFKGIGISIPGIINSPMGIIQYSSNLNIRDFDVLTYMHKHFTVDINIANDADCVALGEAIAGAGKGCRNLITFLISTGVGGGIIIDSKIFSSSCAGGGEIGHQVIVKEGKLCSCGDKGCLEAYASITALIKLAKEKALGQPHTLLSKILSPLQKDVSLDIFFEAVNLGDEVALEVLDTYLEDLAIGINNVITLFKPEKILIAGKLSMQPYDFITPLIQKVKKHIFSGKLVTQIERAQLGNKAQLIGAALLNQFTGSNHQIQLELETQETILRTIIDAVPEDIFYKDRYGRFIGYNKNLSDYYEKKGITNLIGKTELELCPNEAAALLFTQEDEEVIKTKQYKYLEATLQDADGKLITLEKFKVPVLDKEGNVWGIVGVSRDITERKLMEEKLRYLSEIDDLTGLYNRYSFEEKSKELNQSKYFPLGIILGDVNGLKLVNDTLGHLEGDALLKEIAKVLKKACGDKGFVFRLGGDEFIILLPNCDEQGCTTLINKINLQCKKHYYDFIQLSIALGSSVKYSQEENLGKYITEAERKVYTQKLTEKKSINETIFYSIKKKLEQSDIESQKHIATLKNSALLMAKALKLPQTEIAELIPAIELHDLGKIALPKEILLKRGPLSQEEISIARTHVDAGYRIINACGDCTNISKIILTHHERWDGQGYPLGLKETEIPITARILHIADAYSVMTQGCVYKESVSKETALEELKNCAGTQFDPDIVDCFLHEVALS